MGVWDRVRDTGLARFDVVANTRLEAKKLARKYIRDMWGPPDNRYIIDENPDSKELSKDTKAQVKDDRNTSIDYIHDTIKETEKIERKQIKIFKLIASLAVTSFCWLVTIKGASKFADGITMLSFLGLFMFFGISMRKEKDKYQIKEDVFNMTMIGITLFIVVGQFMTVQFITGLFVFVWSVFMTSSIVGQIIKF